MKKTKVVIPALGIIAFATAASITGTVAWFTASKTFTMTAGEFAVVNTKNNLQATLTGQVGTTADNANKKISVKTGYTLTDASFNHRSASNKIIAPNDQGTNLDLTHSYDLSTAIATNESNFEREENSNIYSAFTWDIEFKLNYAQSATKKVGLYFDLSKSWAHKVTVFPANYVPTAAELEGRTFYSDAACTTTATVASAVSVGTSALTVYEKTNLDTGKGFRIAFVPIVANDDGVAEDHYDSFGVAKVWAPNQISGDSHHIDETAADITADFVADTAYLAGAKIKHEGTVYVRNADGTDASWTPANWTATTALADYQVNYVKTKTLEGATATANATGLSLMASGDSSALPAEGNSNTAANNLTGVSNYLGYFKAKGGEVASIKFRCVAWYEGTDPEIVNTVDTVYETMTANLEFTTQNLYD